MITKKHIISTLCLYILCTISISSIVSAGSVYNYSTSVTDHTIDNNTILDDNALMDSISGLRLNNISTVMEVGIISVIQLSIDSPYILEIKERWLNNDIVQWNSSNESVVYIKELNTFTPKIMAMKSGKATITCTIGDKSVSADITVIKDEENPDMEFNLEDEVDSGKIINSKKQLFQYINECLSNGILNIKFSINSPYKVTEDVLKKALELNDEYLYQEMIKNYTDGSLSSYSTNFGIIKHKENSVIGYQLHKDTNYMDDMKIRINKVNKKADDILQSILKDNMTDKEKVLAICTYLVPDCTLYRFLGKDIEEITDPYNFLPYNTLFKKTCLPIGMARTFNLLLRRAGIPCMRIGEGTSVGGLMSDIPYNVARINGELLYFDLNFFNHSSNVKLTNEQKQKRLPSFLSSDCFQTYKKFTYDRAHEWDEEKYSTKYLDYVSVNSEPLLSKINISEAMNINKKKNKSIQISIPKGLTLVTSYTGKGKEIRITYKTSNNKIVTVNSKGKVAAKNTSGTAIITTTVKMQDGTKKVYKTTVTVK